MQAPVDGLNCNPPKFYGLYAPEGSFTDCTPPREDGTVRITEGVTVPSSNWRGVYICFISVID